MYIVYVFQFDQNFKEKLNTNESVLEVNSHTFSIWISQFTFQLQCTHNRQTKSFRVYRMDVAIVLFIRKDRENGIITLVDLNTIE